ncbi:hypothetical protein HUG10_20795 (plasmid) [Halorarum halophilum]|uniref:Ribbon-helix-helix protein, copG family n=1 Tax=Halorarum halophilum TaxID=2743090 RepID=A0A7D5L336_9EURY|nr:DUF5805 domain-containing protein [Halobaculum halophilum]QLG30043.1 hypothetical protein HUG10_20795 [Halobaculum halophilum]
MDAHPQGDDPDVDQSRESMKVYLPAYQKTEWVDHADRLDMNRSEFIRCMVQAGRRDLDLTAQPATDDHVLDLEARITTALENNDSLDWDELVDVITADLETIVDDVLQDLQNQGDISYSGRFKGYVSR